MFVFSMTILHVYYTVSAMYMYMYKCCILMGFIAYWNFQINHLSIYDVCCNIGGDFVFFWGGGGIMS